MILVDLMAGEQRAHRRPGAMLPANKIKTLLKMPMDYGALCIAFFLPGWHLGFFVIYTFLAVGSTGYTLLVVRKWRRDVVALDRRGYSTTFAAAQTLGGTTVLIANPSPDVYGSDLQMLESITALVEAGSRVVVALPSDGPLVAMITERGAEVDFVDFPVSAEPISPPRPSSG